MIFVVKTSMNHLSLFELNGLIKSALDNNLAPSYWVVCEISDLRENQKGHCYLELVEKDGEEVIAKMRGVIWANNYRNLSTWFYSATGQTLKAGLKILANVQIQFHGIFGLNLNIRDIDASFTLGEKEKQKHKVIDQLIEDGIFEMNKTLNFPIVPQNIAIISSPTAAGYEDFINHLKNNQYGYRFTAKLYKSIMQGDEAIPSIIESLHRVNNLVDRFDILVLIRGGGSRVDLDCFDSYDLSSHIAQFPLPVVTGIGHERDESICDLVAHTNLKTPTAVSEFIINQVIEFENSVLFAFDKINSGTKALISKNTNILNQFGFRINVSSQEAVNIANFSIRSLNSELKKSISRYIDSCNTTLDQLEKTIKLLDPIKILQRGYTITIVNSKVLKNVQKLMPNDVIKTESNKLRLISTLKSIEDK